MPGENLPPNNSPAIKPTIRPIAPDDVVRRFSLNKKFLPLQIFLQKDAKDHHNSHVSKTYVIVEGKRVHAYISLSCAQVKLDSHPDDLPGYKYDYPAVKIGKLAVHEDYERRDFGSDLVDLAIAIAKDAIRKHVGCRLLLVDSHQDAVEFYQKKGFLMIDTEENKKRPCPVLFLDIGKL
jgi:GNAT superfamily N-acetyltransferase